MMCLEHVETINNALHSANAVRDAVRALRLAVAPHVLVRNTVPPTREDTIHIDALLTYIEEHSEAIVRNTSKRPHSPHLYNIPQATLGRYLGESEPRYSTSSSTQKSPPTTHESATNTAHTANRVLQRGKNETALAAEYRQSIERYRERLHAFNNDRRSIYGAEAAEYLRNTSKQQQQQQLSPPPQHAMKSVSSVSSSGGQAEHGREPRRAADDGEVDHSKPWYIKEPTRDIPSKPPLSHTQSPVQLVVEKQSHLSPKLVRGLSNISGAGHHTRPTYGSQLSPSASSQSISISASSDNEDVRNPVPTEPSPAVPRRGYSESQESIIHLREHVMALESDIERLSSSLRQLDH